MSISTGCCMELAAPGHTVQPSFGHGEPRISPPPKDWDTDPKTTKELWMTVATIAMSSRGPASRTAGSRSGRATTKTGSDAGKRSTSASTRSLFDLSESQVTPESTITNATRSISPRNAKFAKLVLEPRGILINDTNSIVPNAFSHFGTEQPEGDEAIDYKMVPGLSGVNIWITLDDDAIKDITNEYKEMRGQNLCEEEFATLAKELFLHGERRSRSVSQDRQWRAERMLQLVCPPKESAHWRIPPLLDETLAQETDWTWDIRPDCSYWLSLKGFNAKYRFHIQNATYVRDSITCPYFTVEFKRDGESEDVAVRQACAAGAIALFNRYSLHIQARKVNPELADDVSNIRHYTLTLVGHKFVFWVLRPMRDECKKWTGCEMTRLFGADCTDEYAVQELGNWVNEIHRWGLSRHGPSCERDIKNVLNSSGVRTSDANEASTR
ncbi:uncharacterized protein NECHADRAFT_88424 [Fusarium vanettenii 77-13-4]|uniref:Uncharacterized protein n=1 Tax=Fusarium vanettenii (strain ATCC MYA-4622 / CBS 123669 / FGSC 9596 / NRRL 45880 / 77-13-4) TaxID=660122 RepID=C7ZMD8_FUSV7|nr:uncharacterized protein NECHADRAFT_88424 [Fusarium vanettenii 77-13-4]EEU34837.1 predicted protein [Fusarium vanettenii 77-13-4]